MNAVHHAVAAGFGFAVGASVGSFLNVCVWRLPRGESLVRPASRCPKCESAISFRDNLPVLGWLLLRGRCRNCSQSISPRYPLVEGAVGLLFAAAMLIETLSGPLDLTDRNPLDVVERLGYHWSLLALLVTSALIGHDRRSLSLSQRSSSRDLAPFFASLLSLSACLTGDPLGSVLNLSLLAVFLRGV